MFLHGHHDAGSGSPVIDRRRLTHLSVQWETAFGNTAPAGPAPLPVLITCFFVGLFGYALAGPAVPFVVAVAYAAVAAFSVARRRRRQVVRHTYGPLTDGCVATATYELIIRIDRTITALHDATTDRRRAHTVTREFREGLADVIRAAQAGAVTGGDVIAVRAHTDAQRLLQHIHAVALPTASVPGRTRDAFIRG
jgi:hypothetical protein